MMPLWRRGTGSAVRQQPVASSRASPPGRPASQAGDRGAMGPLAGLQVAASDDVVSRPRGRPWRAARSTFLVAETVDLEFARRGRCAGDPAPPAHRTLHPMFIAAEIGEIVADGRLPTPKPAVRAARTARPCSSPSGRLRPSSSTATASSSATAMYVPIAAGVPVMRRARPCSRNSYLSLDGPVRWPARVARSAWARARNRRGATALAAAGAAVVSMCTVAIASVGDPLAAARVPGALESMRRASRPGERRLARDRARLGRLSAVIAK